MSEIITTRITGKLRWLQAKTHTGRVLQQEVETTFIRAEKPGTQLIQRTYDWKDVPCE